jgi:hypothetical protein
MMDEGHGICKELGAAEKNPPEYGDRHGMKEDAVNWEDPPLHGIFFRNCKEILYKLEK